ncbi:hypothetical protein B0T17DRAFT_620439 [Bombardia bombarda]|uniref:Uncharacterized protein n=1 Tax=Bombardia bombarda TaxID=252184 RepID=A0AA39TUS1_9PEZI|nr:hypothetical protein B0T17DRAFT_620439 [Bombardia bombarda]
MSGNTNTERFEEGRENSHSVTDSKDQRSLANRLAAAEAQGESEDSRDTKMVKEDPTLLARSHGNEPSRGAKIDAQIQQEEEELLRTKDQKN